MLCWLIRSLWWLVVDWGKPELLQVTVLELHEEDDEWNEHMLVWVEDGRRMYVNGWLGDVGETFSVSRWSLWNK